jgi:RNA recognition motif-containing protein
MTSLDSATREALKKSGVGINRDDAIRKRVLGQDDLSKKYLAQLKDKNPELIPPHDTSITTLWVGRLEESVSESDVRDAIISFLPTGVTAQQINVHILRPAKCAFLQFASRDVAEAVALRVQRKLLVAGNVCPFDWAKPKASDSGSRPNEKGRGVKRARAEMLAPPGLESAPVSAYSLQGMPVPVVSGGSIAAVVKVPAADS